MSENSSVKQYSDADELPQVIGEGPHWQDSYVLMYYDEKQGIGGFHRIGHEPHAFDGKGKMVSWAGVANVDGVRFASTLKEPFREQDRLEKQIGCSDAYRIQFDNGCRWVVDDGPYKLNLDTTDFSPRVSPFPHSGETVSDEYAPQHWESAGRAVGEIELDGRRYDIDALCYRDHSWGRRNWTSLASHRWVAGTVGPELTFCAASWQAIDGTLASFGYVVRNGVFEYAETVDILAYMEIDATTNRGGVIQFNLAGGQQIVLHAKPVIPGFISENNTIYCVDQLCQVEFDGITGFCDFETTTNPRCGEKPVVSLVSNADIAGLTQDTLKKWGN